MRSTRGRAASLKRPWRLLAGSLVFALVGCGGLPPGSASRVLPAPSFRDLLTPLGLRPTDLHLKPGAFPADPWRLTLVDALLTRPIPTAVRLESEAWEVIGHTSSPQAILTYLASLVDRSPPPPALAAPEVAFQVPEAPGVPDDLRRALREFIGVLGQADRMIEEALAPLDGETRAFLRDRRDLLGIGGDGLEVDWDEREVVRYLRAAEQVDRSVIVAAGLVTLSGLQALRATVDRLSQESALSGLDGGGTSLLDFSTPWGRVLIGGTERNVYEDPALLILDLGGNDLYRNRAGGTEEGQRVAVVLDLAGDDLYVTEETGAQGAGVLGIGLLVDLTGDDEYRAGDVAQGASLFGVGIHWDREGRDSYRARRFAQGAGGFGIGILLDEAGVDDYVVQAFGQGLGLTGGAGLLLDRRGDDSYGSLGGPADYRQEGHSQSFAQGFGLGLRPLSSGGVGILMDGAGADRYVVDYFGQGGGYWYGLGVLFDHGNGDDRYAATRYVQGTGIHSAVGLVVDRGGADLYRAWGVAQGAGHDLAFGWLRDLAGDDLYQSHWLSQGAGSANGFGLLTEERGDDRYRGGAPTVQGFGRMEREYEALGILLDFSGDDRYTGPGRDGSVWHQGEIGLGADHGSWRDFAKGAAFSPPAEASRSRPPHETFYPYAPVPILPDDPHLALLLEEASTFTAGESAEAARGAAQSELVAIGLEAAPYLVQILRSADIGNVFVAMEVLQRIGSPAIPALQEALGDPAWHVRRRAAALLGRIKEGGVALLVAGGLADPDWGVRAQTAMAIARMADVPAGARDRLARLARGDEDRDVRRAAFLALSTVRDPSLIPVLVDGLRDRDFTVRRAASRVLAGIPEALEALRALAANVEEDPVTRALARVAIEQLEGLR